jgi:hypothetical protein
MTRASGFGNPPWLKSPASCSARSLPRPDAFCCAGTFAHWPVLIDPPREWRFFYSQAAIRWFLGPRVVVFWTYFMGLLFVAAGLFAIWNGLRH